MQIVRNAVAHGIEPSDERVARGQARARARSASMSSRRGRAHRVLVQRRRARRRSRGGAPGRVTARPSRAGGAADRRATNSSRMLLRGGISTVEDGDRAYPGAASASTSCARPPSGWAAKWSSAPRPASERPSSSSFPPSLSSMDALLVEARCGAGIAAIPLDAVRAHAAGNGARHFPCRRRRVDCSRAAGDSFPPAGSPRSMARRWPADRGWIAIVVAANAGMAAIGVERLLGTAKIVVRPLPQDLPASPMVAGHLARRRRQSATRARSGGRRRGRAHRGGARWVSMPRRRAASSSSTIR